MKNTASLVLVLALFSSPLARCADLAANLIKVNGRAERKVQPDIAYLSIEIWSDAKNAKAAQELNASEYARVLDTLTKRFQLEGKNLKTESVSLNPVYRYTAGKSILTGYSSRHQIEIALHQLSSVGSVIDALIVASPESAGHANPSGVNIQGIRFDTEKQQSYEAAVLDAAVKNARARADALASAAGRSVKSVHSISHLTSSPVQLPTLGGERAMFKSSDKAAIPTQVSPGEITISAEVAVEYEF